MRTETFGIEAEGKEREIFLSLKHCDEDHTTKGRKKEI